MPRLTLHKLLAILFVGLVLFLALYNLASYPQIWFDEGSHLHVPKTLIRFGVYADYSSEGYRYFGPSVGIGPTVFLPIAFIFKIFGIGLLQARLVMVVFLLGALYVFYRLGVKLLGPIGAFLALGLVVGSQAISMIEYGRQVLGEVPGLLFLLLAIVLWFGLWEKGNILQLGLVGALFGLAMVTKYQYVIIIVPVLGLSWLANLFYYRTLPQKSFIIPGVVAAFVLAMWMGYQIVYLGPSSAADNLAQFRTFTSGAALVFSPELMQRAMNELVSLKTFAGGFLLFAAVSLFYAIPRSVKGLQWGVLFLIIAINLGWYVVASISWLRYAFPGLVMLSFVAARFFAESLAGIQLGIKGLWKAFREDSQVFGEQAMRYGLFLWCAFMIVVPLGQTTLKVAKPRTNTPQEMANFMESNVALDSLVETWEPEMGFLTDHNYHYPPQILLNSATASIWTGGDPVSDKYDFVQTQSPDYVLIGEFARWVNIYPLDTILSQYEQVTTIGAYELYRLKK